MSESIILAYRPEQVDRIASVRSQLRAERTLVVIALDVETEWALEERNIAFESMRLYKPRTASALLEAERWCDQLFREKFDFFRYRDISLSDVFAEMLQLYLQKTLYYAEIFNAIRTRHPEAVELITFTAGIAVPKTASIFAARELDIVPDMVRAAAATWGIDARVEETTILSVSTYLRTKRIAFALARGAFDIGLTVLNATVALFVPEKPVKIIASDYWWHISPIIKKIDNAEVVLLDRQEIFGAGMRNIWTHRMRFHHLREFVARSEASNQSAFEFDMHERWMSLRMTLAASGIQYAGINLAEVVCGALDLIMSSSLRAAQEIDGAYAMYKDLQPTAVILRASISAQIHFGILAYVATACDIRSIELQHGLDYLGPGSRTKRHAASCVAVYGPYDKQQLVDGGFPPPHILEAGSPRFDYYKMLQHTLAKNEFRIFCNAAIPFLGLQFDTYDVVDYFTGIATACAKIPNARVVIKLRPGPGYERFLRSAISKIFANTAYKLAHDAPLEKTLEDTDVVISYYSTAVLEAMILGIPVVLFGPGPLERLMVDHHFALYEQQEAINIVRDEKKLNKVLAEVARDSQNVIGNAKDFLKEHYLFDGRASEHIATYISNGKE